MDRYNFRKKLYSVYATAHTGQKHGDMQSYINAFPVFDWRLKGHLPGNKEVRCLDIACGAGTFLHYLKQNGYENITGVDVSPEQVALAKQVCDEVHEQDIIAFLSSGQQYDFISIYSFIEHLTRDEAIKFLDTVNKAVRLGGRIILITPNADSPFASHMRYGDVTHEVIYNKGSILALLKACGFNNCRAYETGPVPHGVISGGRWMLWKIITGILKFYRLVEGGSTRGWLFTTEIIIVADKDRAS